MDQEKDTLIRMLHSGDSNDNKLAIDIIYRDFVIFSNARVIQKALQKAVDNIRKSNSKSFAYWISNYSSEDFKEIETSTSIIIKRHICTGYLKREKKVYAKQKGRI